MTSLLLKKFLRAHSLKSLLLLAVIFLPVKAEATQTLCRSLDANDHLVRENMAYRLAGILLGRGLNIDEAKAELNVVTLESLVVAVRVARAMGVRAARGEADLKRLPLLMHVDDILSRKAEVNIPWEDFTFVQE